MDTREDQKGRTDKKVAESIGMKHSTYQKAKKAKKRQEEAGELYGRGGYTKEKLMPNLAQAIIGEKGTTRDKVAESLGMDIQN